MKTSITKALSWQEVTSSYGQQLTHAILTFLPNRIGNQPMRSMGTGIRNFLGWLDRQNDILARDVKSILLATSPLPKLQKIDLLVQAIKRWQCALETKYTSNTVGHYLSRCLTAFDALADYDETTFPTLPRRLFSVRYVRDGYTPSLGKAEWHELDGLTGAARERRALDIVRAEAIEVFEEEENNLKRGHYLLENGISLDCRTNSSSCAIYTFLTTNTSSTLITKPSTWLDAGFNLPQHWKRKNLGPGELSSLRRSCFAPTQNMNLALLRILCCEIGWNTQPMLDIARYPFLLETKTTSGIVSSTFIQSWKNRASHVVLAYLEDRTAPLAPLASENVRAELSAILQQHRGRGSEPYREMNEGTTALDIVRRYLNLAEATRIIFPPAKRIDTLLIYWANGITQYADVKMTPRFQNRRGAALTSIRKTYLLLKKGSVQTLAALRPVANHKRTNILIPHYLNQDEGVSSYKESIRFAQNCIQSLLLEDREKVALEIGMSSQDMNWFLHCAKLSGIKSALLPQQSAPPTSSSPRFTFSPTYENLKNLHLIHFSLTSARFNMRNPKRWKVQGRPLLAFVIALIHAVSSNGLRASYAAASRQALADLRAGRVGIPAVLVA